MAADINDTVQRINLLHDFYGELLTQKQNSYITMHYMEDFSLSEIAKLFRVTPQAAADVIKRAEGLLEKYESKLGLLKQYLQKKDKADEIIGSIDGLPLGPEHTELIESIKNGVLGLIE
jgi:predicted DNA-binding protein YlxM (UPF0122 family)